MEFKIFTIIQQVYLISSIAQYVEKQKQQVKTNKPPYISITVIDISRKRTKKSIAEANNSTKIK